MTSCVLVRDSRVPVGGYETWVDSLAAGLPERGVEVHVVVVGEGHVPSFPDATTVRVPECEDLADQAREIVKVLEALAAQGRRGVFFTMGFPYMNIAGLNLGGSPWANVPVLHGRDPGSFDWLSTTAVQRVVSPSHDYARVARRELRRRMRWFRAINRVVTIPHGVDLPAIDQKLRRKLSDRPVVAIAMRLTRGVKRPQDVIEIARLAMERNPGIRFRIAGSGDAEEDLKSEAPPNVEFVGLVPHHEMQEFLLAADLFLSTSETEAFGLSVAEAMACGNAVVATDIEGPMREMVTSRTGRLVPVGDVRAFVDAIVETIPHARARGAAGRRLVEKRFAADAMLDRYASLVIRESRRVKVNQHWRSREPLRLAPGELTLDPMLLRIRRKLKL